MSVKNFFFQPFPVFIILTTLLIFLSGCTEQDILLVRQTIGADVNGFFDGNYAGAVPFVDFNTIVFDPDFNFVNGVLYAGDLSGDLNWVYLDNYPSACPIGTAVSAIGDSLTCVALSDTNGFVTWLDANATFATIISLEDLNSYVYGLSFEDTNWETSWTTFDSNLSATYRYYSTNYIDFNLLDGFSQQEGRLQWNVDDGTLEFGLPGGNVNLQIGQETLLRVKNTSGLDINNGQVVYISGGSGANTEIGLSNNLIVDRVHDTIGLATEDISNNSFGYVTVFGLVRDLNTSGFVEGERLWVSDVNGGFTNIEPSYPSHSFRIGYVLRSHVNEGVVLVSTQNGLDLDEIDDVLLSNVVDGDVLRFDSVSGTWVNSQIVFNDTNLETFGVFNTDNNSLFNLTDVNSLNVKTRIVYSDWNDMWGTVYCADGNIVTGFIYGFSC